MLAVFTKDYDENPNRSGYKTYAQALSSIAEEINYSCISYKILDVDHIRVTEFGDAELGQTKIYLEYPYGTVTVFAEVEKENPLSAPFK